MPAKTGNVKLAPIGMSVYTRIEHVKKTINALKNNALAKESVLYIFSDAPRSGDEAKVQNMRDFIHKIDGFQEVVIVQREQNSRVQNEAKGFAQLLSQYGKLIWLEEDILTTPSFLTFMNTALNYYEEDPSVFSVTGYSPPLSIPADYDKDFFALQRFSGWGSGHWADKYHQVPSTLDAAKYHHVVQDLKTKSDFCKNGTDLIQMLHHVYHGKIKAFDVNIMFHQFWTKQVTIYPRKSLVQNIGFDGSGVHCDRSNKFDVGLWEKSEFHFSNDVTPDPQIVLSNFDFRFTASPEIYEMLSFELLTHIRQTGTDSLSIFGTGDFACTLFTMLKEKNIHVNFFINSNTELSASMPSGHPIVSPDTAILEGETNFVIAASANRYRMHKELADRIRVHDKEGQIFMIYSPPIKTGNVE